MTKNKYIFQAKKNAGFEEKLDNEIAYFKTRVGLKSDKDYSTREEEVIKDFVYENIMNVNWYKKRTWWERFKRFLFTITTIVLLVAIPFGVFFITKYLNDKGIPMGAEVLTGFITVLLTSILGLHSFFSHLIDNRKFLSQFHQTLTKLRNITFRIDGKWNKLGAGLAHGAVISPAFISELVAATQESRKLVDEDTQAYFEKLSHPTFDLRGSLISNASVAKQLVKQFQAVDLDERVAEQKAKRKRQIEKINEKKDLLESLNDQFSILKEQHARITMQIDAAEKAKARLSDPKDIESKDEDIDVLEDELEPIEWDLALVKTKIVQLEGKIDMASREL